MPLRSERDILEFARNAVSSSDAQRRDLARQEAIAASYYLGEQWAARGLASSIGSDGTYRLSKRMNVDRPQLRVVLNRINRFIEQVSSSTHPGRAHFDVYTKQRDTGAKASQRASVCESLLNLVWTASGATDAAQQANFRRCLAGQYGLQLVLDAKEGSAADSRLRVQCFPAYRLLTDPFQESRDLHDHEWLGITHVITADAAERRYKVRLNRAELPTVGSLTPVEQEWHRLSGSQMYTSYAQYSDTKGVAVTEIWMRGEGRRFDYRYVTLVGGKQERVVSEASGHANPFGGSGLPIAMLRGHPAPGGMWSVSDFAFLRDDQDVMNVLQTLIMRSVQMHTGLGRMVVDKRWFGKNSSDDEIRSRITNMVGGVLIGEGARTKAENISPPQWQPTPPLPSQAVELVRIHTDDMRQQGFRAEAHSGITKSHVPDASFQRAIDEADRVLGQRVESDIEEYQRLGEVVLGTAVRMVRDESTQMMKLLGSAGFSAEEFLAIEDTEPDAPQVTIVMRKSAVQYRSDRARLQTLQGALQAGSVDPIEYRRIMAKEHDLPISELDANAAVYAQRLVRRILDGGQPPVDALNPTIALYVMSEIDTALTDIDLDPEVRTRLLEARQIQENMLNPPQDPEDDTPPPQSAVEPIQASTPGDLLAAALGQQ